ncbi:hypothetical protein [Microbacterium aurum]|uniref:hypothetical protein n=1 Tax=Microbacterium aurum TaxID=36805 RepID=UPI0028E2B5DD|nr:hypothetical protein [Microbacterium aurum]
MTLVAGIAYEGGLTLVSDTKLSFKKDTIASSRVFDNAMNKIALLSDDVAVAISGTNAPLIQERLFALNDKSPLAVIDHLRNEEGGFLVAARKNPTIYVIHEGRVDRIPKGELALEGSEAAFPIYRTLLQSGAHVFHPSENLRASMDSMVQGVHRHQDVGGFVLTVSETREGFRYMAGHSRVAPPITEANGHFVAPAGRSDWLDVMILAGAGATPRAVGIYIVQARKGRLFPQNAPHHATVLPGKTQDEFIENAANVGETLAPLVSPLPGLPLRW